MDKFRIRSGDFIGIVIPGIILCTNLIIMFWSYFTKLYSEISGGKPFDLKETGLLFLLFFILSYITGVILRLFSPDLPDRFSAKMRFLAAKKERGIISLVNRPAKKHPLRGYSEKFPYIMYFAEVVKAKGLSDPKLVNDEEFNKMIDEFSKENLKRDQIKWYGNLLLIMLPLICFAGLNFILPLKRAGGIGVIIFLLLYVILIVIDILKSGKFDEHKSLYPETKSAKDFINYCKLFVINKSPALGEEILFAEGLSRMFSGAFYACLYSIVILAGYQIISYRTVIKPILNLFNDIGQYSWLLIINFILLLVITWGIRHIRAKEANTVFLSYIIVKNDKEK